MANRDIIKTADKVRGAIPTHYDMTILDLKALEEIAKEDLLNAFTIAFRYGYTMGHRATEAGKYEEKKTPRRAANWTPTDLPY